MPHPLLNTFDQNFDIDIWFKVVEKSKNYVFENENPPTALRTRVVSYALGAYKVFIESIVVKTSKSADSIGN